MRIGILTFHYVNNYGAMLQTYALKTYLSQQGHDVHVINYRNATVEKPYLGVPSIFQLIGRRGIFFPWRWPQSWRDLREKWLNLPEWKNRNRKFRDFEKDFLLNQSVQPILPQEIGRLNFDAIIFGSDQIWNTDITGNDEKIYWGQFPATETKKIVYGASIYTKELTEREKANVQKFISSFDAISVREQTLANQITALTGQAVATVVDPTLLLPFHAYGELTLSLQRNTKPFVLCYFMKNASEWLNVVKQLGLPVKILGCRSNELICDIGEDKVLDVGPAEFLGLFSQATYVVTNSFHGTALSILSQRPFCVIGKKDARIENLLVLTGLESAQISEPTQFSVNCFQISKQKNLEKLKSVIDQSKSYLKEALGEK